MKFLTAIAVFSCLLFLTGGAHGGNYKVTVHGYFYGYDGTNGVTFPLAGARIELMNSNADGSTIFDDIMGTSYVQEDGSFSVTGTGVDPGNWNWSKPDVYIRVVYNDDHGVRLTDELDNDRYADTPEHDHNNFEGTLDIGSWVTGVGVQGPSPTKLGDGTQPGVWHEARQAYMEYQKIVGTDPPAGHYDVEYWSGVWSGTPWTNDNTTHWPIHYPTVAVRHEFGHTIRHSFDGDRDHFNWDVTRFRYARSHDICDANSNRIPSDTRDMGLAYGFNEGWAEFWEDRIDGCWAITIDDESEGNNAYGLGVLSKFPGIGKAGMVAILRDHPGKIHSLDEFVNFFAVANSMAISALSQELKKDRSVNHEVISPMLHPVLDKESQVASANKEIAEISHMITNLNLQLRIATEASIHPPQCDSIDCIAAFEALLRPTILKAEIAIKKYALTRIQQTISPTYIENFNRTLATGDLDKDLDRNKREYYRKLGQINIDALKSAIGVTKSLQEKSNVAKMLGEDLRGKLNLLQKIVREGRPLPLSAQSQVVFSEDTPRVKR
jgi:hypothetical protein